MADRESLFDHDAIVVGAGFGGIYMLHKLRNLLGLDAVAIERESGVGGTWYKNRYPGALSDSLAHLYCYAFSDELLQEWTFASRYVAQPEVLAYLKHVVGRFDLQRSITFNTSVVGASFDEKSNIWTIRFDDGSVKTCRYFISSVGVLDRALIPSISGQESFRGISCHTSEWPATLDCSGKRVAVIGSGSTGTQLVAAIAPIAKQVIVLIRRPQYSVPIGNRPLTKEEIGSIKDNYRDIWNKEFASSTAFGDVAQPALGAFDVSDQERERAYQHAWDFGGPFHFFVGTFKDILTNPAANETAANFIRNKIKEIVTDPEKARKLTPTEPWLRRPIADSGFYATFNRDNVDIEHLGENPIDAITADGIRMADGTLHEVDIIVYATGFDGVTGALNRIDIRGLGGRRLRDQWQDRAGSFLGVAVSNFPNMFTVFGPYGPFANNPPLIASEVEFIGELISYADQNGVRRITVRREAEDGYVEACEAVTRATLIYSVKSWITGGNIDGKPQQLMFNLNGLGAFRAAMAAETASNYPSFIMDHEARRIEPTNPAVAPHTV